MKILLVTGSYPPDPCGVGDYTARLEEALRDEAETQVSVLLPKTGPSLRLLYAITKAPVGLIIHLQYPTVGFGWSLLPVLWFMAASQLHPTVLTAHEFARAHPLRKMANLLMMAGASRILFTNEADRDAVLQYLPSWRAKCEIIPIGSNLPSATSRVCASQPLTVSFFGFLRPGRGVEAFLEAAGQLNRDPSTHVVFRIIGHCLPEHASYLNQLRAEWALGNLEWHLSMPAGHVSNLLATSHVAYLPVPGGIGERNGTVLAALCAGLHVFAPFGQATSPLLSRLVHRADSPEAFAKALVSQAEAWMTAPKSEERSKYVELRSWKAIARAHLKAYAAVSCS